MSIVFWVGTGIDFGYSTNKLILHLSGIHNNRHKGTLIYSLKLNITFECIYSSASAHPKGLIELKTQRYSIYIQFDSVSYFSS